MKIFHTISNKEWGGGEQTVLDLCHRQLADGIEVELCCIPLGSMVERFRVLDVPIHQMPLRGILDLKSALRMAKLLKSGDVDVVHVAQGIRHELLTDLKDGLLAHLTCAEHHRDEEGAEEGDDDQ